MDVPEALADPVRRGIVELLARGDEDAGGIAARFPISRPAISRHLRVLREAGLVHVEAQGQRRVYTLQREPLAGLRRWLEGLEGVEPAAPTGPASRLNALDTELHRGRRKRRSADSGGTDARSAG